MVIGIFSSDISLELIYGFGFLFFTLLFASMSDIVKMKIKRSFMYMWIGFAIIFLLHDYLSGIDWLKWIIIFFFAILSWRGIGKILKLERADVVAIVAVSSILTLSQMILFYVILILVNKLIVYPLRFFGRKRYPFIPVIWVSLTILFLALGIINWNLFERIKIIRTP